MHGTLDQDRLGSRDRTFSIWDQDDQEQRAIELEALGNHNRADRVRKCGLRVAQWRRISRCKIRGWCPACDARLAAHYAWKMTAAIRRMVVPQVFLITVPVYTLEGLGDGIDRLQTAMGKLKQRKLMKGIRGSVFFIEPNRGDASGRAVWNVHAHLVLDVVDFDVSAADAAWHGLTGGRFLIHDHPAVKTPEGCGRYATKPDTWAPPPGKMAPRQLQVLADALHGVHALTTWGSARPPTDRTPDGTGPRAGGEREPDEAPSANVVETIGFFTNSVGAGRNLNERSRKYPVDRSVGQADEAPVYRRVQAEDLGRDRRRHSGNAECDSPTRRVVLIAFGEVARGAT